MKIRKKDR